MKNYLLLVLAMYPLSIFSQDSLIRANLDRIITVAQTTSLYRENVDWEAVRDSMFQLAADAKEIPQLAPAFNYLLESIQDEHGRIYLNNQVLAYYYSGELKEHQKAFDLTTFQQVQSGVEYPFRAEMIGERIGYIRIAGLGMGDNQQLAKSIEDEVCRLMDAGADRWIVDLRFNGGGNLNPMVEGLAAIIGDGLAGGAKGVVPADDAAWEILSGDFFNNGYSIRMPNTCSYNSPPKVAVLTSLYTASSGEALAVIFKGRERTRFFGGNTLGLVTGTNWEMINEQLVLSISTNYFQDRTGKVYQKYVDVDEEITYPFDPKVLIDPCVRQSVSWLLED
jgi:carboxyl-terminal processing protease